MDEARVVINLKEGIIELQGPVDFVRHYLDAGPFAIKELQGLSKNAAMSPQKAKALPRERKEVPGPRAGKPKRASGPAVIRGYLQEGFFDEPRSLREVKQRLTEMGLARTNSAVRTTLGKLLVAGLLERVTKGRSVRFQRPVQS